MNRTLVLSMLRQRLSSPMRLALLAITFLPGLGIAVATRTLTPLHDTASLFALILAAGAIGQEVSSGVLQLTFARPVSRPSYVFSRWFAAGAIAAALSFVQLGLGTALIVARGTTPELADLGIAALENGLLAFACAAVMVMLSSLVNGLGDVGVYVLGLFTFQVSGTIAQFKHWPVLARAATELSGFLKPSLQLAWLAGRGEPDLLPLVSLLSTCTISLAVAVLVINRKELSYAAD